MFVLIFLVMFPALCFDRARVDYRTILSLNPPSYMSSCLLVSRTSAYVLSMSNREIGQSRCMPAFDV